MEIIHIDTIGQVHDILDYGKPNHPLVTVIDYSKTQYVNPESVRIRSGFYMVTMKTKVPDCRIRYGRENYDFQDGTMMFMAPEQVMQIEPESGDQRAEGWSLFFHPDLLRRSSLAGKMKDYTFFSYEANEALHLSDSEKQTLAEIIQKIELELSQNIDRHSQTLLLSNIELLLNYCVRFYDRQFITREHVNLDAVTRFEKVLTSYLNADSLAELGLPTVRYCAEKMNLSPNYLSDLLKKETGKNTQEHIHYHLVERAKNMLLGSNDTVSEIAYELGFEYPQHFSKLFKNKTGITPARYRALN